MKGRGKSNDDKMVWDMCLQGQGDMGLHNRHCCKRQVVKWLDQEMGQNNPPLRGVRDGNWFLVQRSLWARMYCAWASSDGELV